MNIFDTLLIEPLANGLILFYKLLGGNLGLAIIFFTLVLKTLLHPLTKPYMESMKRMKDLAPELEKLKKKHKNDKIKLAQAQSDFYKSKGINPGAGCLPYILQIVVLIAFFNMFNRVLSGDANPVEQFNHLLYEPLRLAANETIGLRFLFIEDLRQPDVITNYSVLKNYDFVQNLSIKIPGLIIILAAVSQFLSAKIMQPYTKAEEKVAKSTEEKTDDMQVMMQQMMIYIFPFFTLFIGTQFAAALALYWLVFSLSQAYQQYRLQGFGGLTPWIERYKLLKSVE